MCLMKHTATRIRGSPRIFLIAPFRIECIETEIFSWLAHHVPCTTLVIISTISVPKITRFLLSTTAVTAFATLACKITMKIIVYSIDSTVIAHSSDFQMTCVKYIYMLYQIMVIYALKWLAIIFKNCRQTKVNKPYVAKKLSV